MRLSAPIYRLKRQAHLQARKTGQPLHASLDAVARAEGFRSWDHLSAKADTASEAATLLDSLPQGSLTLLAARPGHGKTLLTLEMALEAAKRGPATFYTLDYSPQQIADRVGARALPDAFRSDHSDEISADYIIAQGRAGFIAVDYLQLLDQRRDLPPLEVQCRALAAYATRSGARIILISQVDRRFDGTPGSRPGPDDIRLPNPLDLRLFDRLVFLHDGVIEMQAA